MRLLLLLTAFILTSCGQDYSQVILQENKYDDTQVKAMQVVQEARIAALEARLDAFNTNFDDVLIDFGERLNNQETLSGSLGEALDTNLTILNNALIMLQNQVISVVPICNSGENLIKSGNSLYAVYMISNNYGTFLGKLSENVNYRTTDAVQANFKIVNNVVVCL